MSNPILLNSPGPLRKTTLRPTELRGSTILKEAEDPGRITGVDSGAVNNKEFLNWNRAYSSMKEEAFDVAANEYNQEFLKTARVTLPDPIMPEPVTPDRGVLTSTNRPGIERRRVEGKPVFSSEEDFARAQSEASTLGDTTPIGPFTPYKPGFKADTTLKADPRPRPRKDPDLLTETRTEAPRDFASVDARRERLGPQHAFDRFASELPDREGYELAVYKDSLGYPTVGIGHRVLPEDNLKLGDTITKERADELYRQDTSKAFNAAKGQIAELGIDDHDFLTALAKVNFQLGPNWTEKFYQTWPMIKAGRYGDAADNLTRSKWYEHTPKRVRDFQKALRALEKRRRQFSNNE